MASVYKSKARSPEPTCSTGVTARGQHGNARPCTHSVLQPHTTDKSAQSLTFCKFLELCVLIQQADVGLAPPYLSVLVILIVVLVLTGRLTVLTTLVLQLTESTRDSQYQHYILLAGNCYGITSPALFILSNWRT
jgi:hypothetical protein